MLSYYLFALISGASASFQEPTGLTSSSSCPLKCKSTCSNPNPVGCDPNPSCNCQAGYVWTSDGANCIPISQCPSGTGCNGDSHAHITENPPPCSSTCDAPDGLFPCNRMGLAFGCVCDAGYIRNRKGLCVLPDKCPGGNPCGVNGTFVPCKYECPNNFCPVDGRHGQVVCDPTPNCRSGCACKYKYRWRSEQNRQCILAQECPPRDCPEPNEFWNSCPSPCIDDSCANYSPTPAPCNTFQEPECNPQCTCKPSFARNAQNLCIPGEDCPEI